MPRMFFLFVLPVLCFLFGRVLGVSLLLRNGVLTCAPLDSSHLFVTPVPGGRHPHIDMHEGKSTKEHKIKINYLLKKEEVRCGLG